MDEVRVSACDFYLLFVSYLLLFNLFNDML